VNKKIIVTLKHFMCSVLIATMVSGISYAMDIDMVKSDVAFQSVVPSNTSIETRSGWFITPIVSMSFLNKDDMSLVYKSKNLSIPVHLNNLFDDGVNVGIEGSRKINKHFDMLLGIGISKHYGRNIVYENSTTNFHCNISDLNLLKMYGGARLNLTDNVYFKLIAGTYYNDGVYINPTDSNAINDHILYADKQFNFLYGGGFGIKLPINDSFDIAGEVSFEQAGLNGIIIYPVNVGMNWYF
jgi:hypothetical protein